MHEVDGSKFIVRNASYPQDADYGDFCANAVRKLQQAKPATAKEATLMLGSAVQKYFGSFGFGQIRTMANGVSLNDESKDVRTSRGKKYEHYAQQVISLYPNDLGALNEVVQKGAYRHKEITYQLPDTGETVVLGNFKRAGGNIYDKPANISAPGILVYWSSLDNIDAVLTGKKTKETNGPKVWQALEHSYSTALDKSAPPTERRDAALESYYLFSHMMPFDRGSSSAAHMLLEYLGGEAGVPIPHMKEGVDLNLEALTRSWPDFRRTFLKGDLMDMRASGNDVREWQKNAIRNADARPRTSGDLFNDIIAIASEGKNASLHTVQRMLFRQLLHPPAGAEYRMEVGTDDSGKTCVRFLDPNTRFLNGPYFFNDGSVEDVRFPDNGAPDSPFMKILRELKTGNAVLTHDGIELLTRFHPIAPERLEMALRSEAPPARSRAMA